MGNVTEIEAAMEALDVEIEIGMISQAAGDAKKATLLGMKMLAGTPLPPHAVRS